MPRLESATDLVDQETRHIDVVASWENLNDTYDTLRFSDDLADDERLEEYKWIVQQMNAFLSKMRAKLLSCKDEDAMTELLSVSVIPQGKVNLSTRRALVYQKLRQQWVRMMAMKLNMMKEEQDV